MFFHPPRSHCDEYLTRGRRAGFPVRLENTDRLGIVPPPPFNLPHVYLSLSHSLIHPLPPFLYIPLRENPRRCLNGGGAFLDLLSAISSSLALDEIMRALKLFGSKIIRNRE